jgi:phage tail sheath protein FI
MATAVLKVPGVYRQEQPGRSRPVLPTGVPAFVGLVQANAPVPAGAPITAGGYGPVALRRKADFPGGAAAYLEHAVTGFFDNGGDYCYVVGVRADASQPAAAAAALGRGLQSLAPLSDVDLIAVPDAVALGRTITAGVISVDEAAVRSLQLAMIQHCTEQATRLALLDGLPGKDALALIETQLKPLGVMRATPINAALYHPWVRSSSTGGEFVPPCGHVAGVIARTDAIGGVFKAPANAEIQGAIDLEADLDVESLGLLNQAGVNCLRAFPARGIRVWGARTPSAAPEWRYLNVRRLVLTIVRWIELNMAWAAFEPNVPALWARIERELSGYLGGLWRAGALKGEAVSEAFYVRCDAELNAAASRDAGQVITEIGLAPTLPAEFIVVSVQHRAGTTELI